MTATATPSTSPAASPAPATRSIEYRQIFVDGRWVDTATGASAPVINPATEEAIGIAPIATAADARKAIEAARRAFDDGPWPSMTPAERSAVLVRMADIMDRRKSELVALNMAETGSTRVGAESFHTTIPIAHFRDMAQRVLPSYRWEEPLAPHVGMGIGQGVIRREPFGVAAVVSAYNFPLYLNLMKLAPALAAGCTVVLKPAPTTPLEALILGEIAEEAGLPDGVLNIVTGDIDVGTELSTSPLVDIVSFTGSDAVGRKVAEQASPTLKKVVLELGGKSANIICEDADLTKVLPGIVRDTVLHAGQGCGYLTRTLVHRSRYDELVDMVKGALAQIVVGDPADPATVLGPLQTAEQRARVEALIASGVAEGATLALGGGRPAHLDKGFFIEPTLFVDVDNSMTIARKEFFGPVMIIMAFDTDDEAVAVANDNEYGLAGGVWAKDPVRAYQIAQRIRTGYITVNGGGGGLSPHGPFGGYKQSGLGRERGAIGMEEYLETKSIIWGVAAG
ncbi:aldehyde dehydrogenase family protein [Gordonia pseudamarae]|jgi:aldehyde dehydrogenase (NAD+)|uniref:Aldehyde dehydrogenase family protein n=1 Tax=Gordonia pseudamarae TaxID=2831662 RepID=A0ABX6IED5_9ACTN|nr:MULTISPECIES: aldehyde dehydrogenase family protein [Gordonia]MBD0021749.1 aldehyde dehydrogenase family protein [Gordonia sp. (in: high G+C Gram-positive bacteria)]QHN25281.1 aldehyde dehydrogenase family protein [Gordonia pseudamarae]QHN34212.1 aldehyde dehydrogenase family protein [Gordonia pseudamarae]